MKRNEQIEKDFTDCKVYDLRVKDVFGNKFYVLHNELLNEVRFISKNKEYIKERNKLDRMGLKYVIVQKYGSVIDLSEDTYKSIQKKFTDAKLPCIEMLNILNC